jgi:hypothetical protein
LNGALDLRLCSGTNNAGSPRPRQQIAKRINGQLWWLVVARMGVAMMRLSDQHLSPARTGLMIVAAFLLCAVMVRVIAVYEGSEVRAHIAPESGGRAAPDIGVADLRGSLP